VAMEVQNRETKQQLWVEEDQKSQRTESSAVVVSDKEAVVEAIEKWSGRWACSITR